MEALRNEHDMMIMPSIIVIHIVQSAHAMRLEVPAVKILFKMAGGVNCGHKS